MKSIEQMIKRLCPKGVEYVKLGEVASIKNGRDHKKYEDGDVPVYGSGGVMRHIDTFIYNQPSVLLPRKGSLGNVLFVDEPFWTVDTMFWTVIDSRRVNEKFLFYYLKNYHIEKLSLTNGGAVPSLTQSQLNDILVPLPPMEVQNRIVEVLDKMTTLTAELEAELEARKQQYEYYRNKLLTFSEIGGGIRFVKLGDVGKFYGGLSGKSKNDFVEGNSKFITYMNVYSNPSLCVNVDDKVFIKEGEKQNTIQFGDILFTGSSETPDECGMSSVLTTHVEEKLYLNSFCFGYRFDDLTDINPHFMKHLFRSASVRKLITKTANGVTRFNVSKKLFAEIVIPIPPLSEQQRIVSILDRFEALTTDLQSGLPAEIEARRQQYEYYRNKLLTFDQAV